MVDWENLRGVSEMIDEISKNDSRERLNAVLLMERMEFEETRG